MEAKPAGARRRGWPWDGVALLQGMGQAGALPLLFPHLQLLFQKTMCEKWEAWQDPPSYVSILGQAEALKPLCSTSWLEEQWLFSSYKTAQTLC